jgi:hypothetical protein
MRAREPIDCPSVESEACDCCNEPWADEVDRDNGPRKLRLCEAHHDAWTRGARELAAEREEMAGREPKRLELSALFGLARALDGHVTNGRKAS